MIIGRVWVYFIWGVCTFICALVHSFVRWLAHNSFATFFSRHSCIHDSYFDRGRYLLHDEACRPVEKRTQIKINISFSLLLFATWSLHKLPLHCGRTSLAHSRLLSFCYDFSLRFVFMPLCYVMVFIFTFCAEWRSLFLVKIHTEIEEEEEAI